MKYIIKNCPNISFAEYSDGTAKNFQCGLSWEDDKNCSDCTDCKLKQVVEKCWETTKICDECQHWRCDDCSLSTNGLAQEILVMFEIEEIEK